MAVARRIAYNVFVSSISKILSTILALVAIGFITRYLGTEGFGEYAIVLAFLSFFAALADLGLYPIATREISRAGADEEKIISNIFSLRIITAIAVFIISPIVVWAFPYPEEVKKGIIIVAASFIFSSGYQVLNGIFQKRLIMDRVAIAELVGKIIQVGVVILAVRKGLGFNWVVSALLLNMVVSFTIVFLLAKKYVRFVFKVDLKQWKSFLKESLPMGISSIIIFIYFKMDTILLSIMKGSAEVGIYNAAYKVLENITFFPAMVVGLVFPIMSKNIFINKAEFKNISNKTFKFFIVMVVPLIVGVLFLSEEIINIIGGGEFAQSAPVLRILVFALGLIFFGHFFNNILIAGNLQKKLVKILAVVAIINVVGNLIFIPRFSYFGSAYISVITEMVVVFLTALMVFRKIDYVPRAEKFSSILLSGLIMASFLFVFKEFNFFMLTLGGALIYFIFLWIFKAVKTSELLSLISRKGVEEYEEIP
ncbi:MAG: hypothetical protein COU40_03485 [Candidatus Moranbacteria bacterium CG10_big_fil_rev_8_21_14_0_10_35_21]|nr:MAG: hypothetical protein COU40_03485 [Candidatus Moranbacteria bacterium CG10_big_fil_rev_8_21_14_0_10_35_21]PJA88757.1 MAG: hypothetical protein CO139_01415 [Candidatus Moranbacteria bacterium CG_4_9_14_3_um_filter_36_9]